MAHIYVNEHVIALSLDDRVIIYDKQMRKQAVFKNLHAPSKVQCLENRYYVACNKSVIELGHNSKTILTMQSDISAFVAFEKLFFIATQEQLYIVDSISLSIKKQLALRIKAMELLGDELYLMQEDTLMQYAYTEVKMLHTFKNIIDLCVGKYGDGCGGGRVFLLDNINYNLKAYAAESNDIINLHQFKNKIFSIAKSGCEIFILQEDVIAVMNLSTMQIKKVKL